MMCSLVVCLACVRVLPVIAQLCCVGCCHVCWPVRLAALETMRALSSHLVRRTKPGDIMMGGGGGGVERIVISV